MTFEIDGEKASGVETVDHCVIERMPPIDKNELELAYW